LGSHLPLRIQPLSCCRGSLISWPWTDMNFQLPIIITTKMENCIGFSVGLNYMALIFFLQILNHWMYTFLWYN
jgi:hypothetical protein